MVFKQVEDRIKMKEKGCGGKLEEKRTNAFVAIGLEP